MLVAIRVAEFIKDGAFIVSLMALRQTVIFVLSAGNNTSSAMLFLKKASAGSKLRLIGYGLRAIFAPVINFRKEPETSSISQEKYHEEELFLGRVMHNLGVHGLNYQDELVIAGKAVACGQVAIWSALISLISGLVRLILKFCV
jgi:hypothetical protein